MTSPILKSNHMPAIFRVASGVPRSGYRVARATGAFCLTLLLGACNFDEVLDVPDPDVATPESVQDKAALPVVRTGAVGDLQVAFSGGGEDSQITLSGVFTDELNWAESFPTRLEVDTRNIEIVNGTMDGIYRGLQRARATGDRAAAAFARLDATNPWHAEVISMSGFAQILLGENYCSGVPFSRLSIAGETEFGEPQTTTQIFTSALARFDAALAVLGTQSSATAAVQRNLASVGKGRALLNLNRPADAKAAVANVLTTFAYELQHSENSQRQFNGTFIGVNANRRFGTTTREGTNGLPYRADSDPRVAVDVTAVTLGIDSATRLYAQLKYGNRSANVRLADGVEARLIEAEADLRAGNAAWLTTLNTLRTGVGLAALAAGANQAANVDILFKERAYWMWLTSHRLGDLRRLVRQYQRGAETVFPTGAFFKGGTYGPDVNFPIPFDEINNPKFTACLDRNA